MKFRLAALALVLALGACATKEPPPTQLERANVLPLAINDDFQFRKVNTFLNNPFEQLITTSESGNFQRRRYNYGAIDKYDLDEKTGNYFTFFWRNRERADVTMRLEYRQVGLGNLVLAKERYYPAALGSYKSEFQVTGDDFLEHGRVSSWRGLLIVNGEIVALTQSFLWK